MQPLKHGKDAQGREPLALIGSTEPPRDRRTARTPRFRFYCGTVAAAGLGFCVWRKDIATLRSSYAPRTVYYAVSLDHLIPGDLGTVDDCSASMISPLAIFSPTGHHRARPGPKQTRHDLIGRNPTSQTWFRHADEVRLTTCRNRTQPSQGVLGGKA